MPEPSGSTNSLAPEQTAGNPVVQHTETDIQQLIQALNVGFSQLLEQNKDQAEKFQRVMEALKPPVTTTDSKTTFWNAYKTVADEYDKEFLQKWGTDLDAALIFAGLFSAVTSAFIILIQPSIQHDDTPTIVIVSQSIFYISLGSTLFSALLSVLGKQWLMHYSAAGERGTNETRGLERQRKLDGLKKWKFNQVMQLFPLLLQFGLFLFSAGLSTYLWTIHVTLAVIVLTMMSIGSVLYIALLFSTVAFPDSPFYSPLAPLVSPFLPIASWIKLTAVLSKLMIQPHQLIQQVYSACKRYFHCPSDLLPHFYKTQASNASDRPLPFSLSCDEPFSLPSSLQPSAEASAISWVLETSTDPHVVTAAAEVAVGLQWPSGLDLGPQLNNLWDNFLMCFNITTRRGAWKIVLDKVHQGMSNNAVHLGQAYGVLCCAHMDPNFVKNMPSLNLWDVDRSSGYSTELKATLQVLMHRISLDSEITQTREWALHVIPCFQEFTPLNQKGLLSFLHKCTNITCTDTANFTDYIFCLCSFVTPMNHYDMVWNNKSHFQAKLFAHLFQILTSRITKNELSLHVAAKIIDTIHQISRGSSTDVWNVWNISYAACQSILYGFFSSLPLTDGWSEVGLAIGRITEMFTYAPPFGMPATPWDLSIQCKIDHRLINKALEEISIPTKDNKWDSQTTAGVSGLLWCLLYEEAPPAKENIHLLLHALFIPDNHVSHIVTLLLLHKNVRTWYQDDGPGHFLRDAEVWPFFLNRWLPYHDTPKSPKDVLDVLELGQMLVELPAWQSHIHNNLCSLIDMFSGLGPNWQSYLEYKKAVKLYRSILCAFSMEADGHNFTGGKQALALSLSAISKFWDTINIANTENQYKCLRWLRSTCWAALHDNYYNGWDNIPLPSDFKPIFIAPLQNSLLNFATVTRQKTMEKSIDGSGEIAAETKEFLGSIGNILEEIANEIAKPTDPAPRNVREHYRQFTEHIFSQIGALETTISEHKSVTPV